MNTDKESQLLVDLHHQCRALLRYNGVDSERANKAYDAMKEATHAVTDFYKNRDETERP